jgi:hypothetical protein
VVDQAKVFGVTYTQVFNSTVSASWDRVAAGVERVLQMWSARRLPTLCQRSLVVESFALSKVWYLPLPPTPAVRLCRAAGDFLWRGWFEQLAHDELHGTVSSGGLQTSAIQSRAEALLAKQACHRLVGGGACPPHRLLGGSPPPPSSSGSWGWPPCGGHPHFYKALASLLEKVLALPGVNTAALLDVTSKFIYEQFTATLPPPKIEARLPELP